MKILITICARGGSKGLPGKNTKELNGKPLIVYSLDVARRFMEEQNADLVISTDSDEIKEVCRTHGFSTDYERPDWTATDSISKIPAIKDAKEYMEDKNSMTYDYVLDLDVTSPLRTIKDLKEAFELLSRDSNALNIFSVSPPSRNPYFNMVERKESGYYSTVVNVDEKIQSRQNAPIVYDMNASFYFYRKEFFDLKIDSAITNKSLIYIVPHICFDVDEPIDLNFMGYILSKGEFNFDE